MNAQPMQLLTILTEAVLEDTLIDEIMELGAKGYTISEARGRGTHGVRTGKWAAGGNIRIEVVGDAALCRRIVERLHSQYERDYGLLMFTCAVELQN
jgi:hypothetical protein